MLALAVTTGLHVTAVYVNHGLRGGEEREAEAVRNNAEQLGAGFEVRQVRVGEGPNLEERARLARHAALGPAALLGHTADDQAETVLLNMIRGSGLHGLAGMRTDDGRRPILAIRRAETRALCSAIGLELTEDPSNHDPRFTRNRVRHRLMPLLDEIAERDVVPLLCRLADIARQAGDHLDLEAALIDVSNAQALREAGPVLAPLAVRRWLADHGELGHPPDRATIDRVLAVARLDAVATDVGRGWQVRRSGGHLQLRQIHPPPDERSEST